MRANLLPAAFLCSLASALALPTSNLPRAGGPAIVPIPSTCTVTQPVAATPSFLPAPATTAATLYSAYYPSFSSNKTQMAQQCLQQCYGYGTHTECKTAYWAENVVIPKGYYGTEGGGLATACLMFDRELGQEDFVLAPEGQGTGAWAGVIEC
ncbi:uncharacterized protein yc1106_01939 [Curvularia clavata]|uniref:Uncharacterized protein n=1 Tax=Curvularia clavata TaxID=95742 RepID=A0A9Q9DQ18_CURCL|nr:uncharacterized protein yc1106_01939 [Curvularia clavata]